MLDLHVNSEFWYSLSMIHAYDVINWAIIEGAQKTFAQDHFELVQKIFISIIFLYSLDLDIELFCIGFRKNPIRRSGNWQKVKNFRAGPFQEFSSNLSFLGLLSHNIEWLRGFLPFWCLSVDKSRNTTKNIFQSLTVKIRKTKTGNIRSVIHQIEAFIALIAKILFWWSTDHRTGSSDLISYQLAKSAIFEVIL